MVGQRELQVESGQPDEEGPSGARRELGWVALIAMGTAAVGLGLVEVWAPGYLTNQGFPLDDSWIHAVYGRSFATTGTLAYNPGIPATGATSLLWALLLAIPHGLAEEASAAVTLTKLLGFMLHILCAVTAAWAVSFRSGSRWSSRAAALLVAGHPALLAASISGMEIPLAGLGAAAVLLALRAKSAYWIAPVAALAVLARPEVGLLCAAAPFLLYPILRNRWTRVGLAASGTAVGLIIGFAHNLYASGRWLPATFHAKVGEGHGQWIDSQLMGFGPLLNELPLMEAPILLTLGIASAVVLAKAYRGRREVVPVGAAAGVIAGLLYFAVSFALIVPVDPLAFYHQRYVMPAMPLVLAATPVLVAYGAQLLARRSLRIGVLAATAAIFVASFGLDIEDRLEGLGNDTRNIDDTQVQEGIALSEVPADTIVWAVDAGAIRFFGNAFIVDTIGLNTPQVLGPDAAAYLDAHRPTFLEVVEGWSALSLPSSTSHQVRRFSPTTAYTVTSFPPMKDRYLVKCLPQGGEGRFVVRGRMFNVTCAEN